jgi:multicomponent Na+:H+ antiporter subunit E
VVEVRLASGSEFVIAMMVETLCLIPGSVVIGVRPAQGLIYAHVLGVDDDAAVADFRAQCARWEASLVRALGRPMAPAGPSTRRTGGGAR